MRQMVVIMFFIISALSVSAQGWVKVPAKYVNVSIIDNRWMADHGKISFDGIEEGTRFAFLGRVDRIASSNDGSSGTTSSYISWLAHLSTLSNVNKAVGRSVNLVFIFRDMPVIKKGDVVVLYAEYTGRPVGDTAPWKDAAVCPLFHGEYYVCDTGFKNF